MEEAPVVVTAATGDLGPVVARLSPLLRWHGEYKLRRGTLKDIKRIRSKLKSIHSMLWVIWEREDLDATGKALRMEAWRLADDMNDAIDDFILSLKHSDDGRRLQAKNQLSPFQDLKRRADDVWERCRKKWKKMDPANTTFSSLFSRTKTTSTGKWRHRAVDPYVHKDISALVVVDMEKPRDKLIKHLIGEEESTQQIKMASILGGAGMGKTTLARLVYEDEAIVEDKFQARAFVSITSCHNMTEVLARIYQQVQGQADSSTVVPLACTKAETALIDVISNFLKDKRYLVIIDDIWLYGEWEIIKKSLPDNNLGSRIVTTSRVKSITEKWHEDFDALVHKIERTRTGFSDKMIDRNADLVGEGFDYDHLIVEMCHAMPLAVACMFSALAKERERQEQQRLWQCIETRDLQDRIVELVTRNGIQNTPGFEPLVESLDLGYKDLAHHMLKTCLLYCSIYPKDHQFERDEMVRRWIAQGFVHKEEEAKDYFDEFVSRSFITFEGYLHPMMRNYLRCKLREDNFITCTSDGVPSSPVGRLCIDDNWLSSDAVDPLSKIDYWQHIRSLVVFKDVERVPYKHLEHLRVLEVQGIEPLEPALENQHLKDMCGLLRLRHLLLSGRWPERPLRINEMPAEIARLQYLETLKVTATDIERLPAEIGDLKQLKTLDLSLNQELAELPKEIGKLRHLEVLEMSCTGITELPKEIGKLRHLEVLKMNWTGITELPREIGNLQRLQILYLDAVPLTKLPRDIGKLQHLETLLLNTTNVKIPREIGGLKKLKNLDAYFRILPLETAQLSKLEGLPNCMRQVWKNSDLVSSLAGEILSFSKRTWQALDGDGGLVVSTKHMHIPLWIKEHFNNIAELDIRICKLEEQDLKILQEMPYLQLLYLRFEAVPRKPIVITNVGFSKLKCLVIDSRVPRITFQEGAMPRLATLVFEFQFYGGSPNTDHPMGIKHLVSLLEVSFRCNKWYRGDSPCISATIDVVRKEAWEHPNRNTLLMSVYGGQNFVFEIAESPEGSNEASSSGANEIEEIQA